MTKRMRLCRSFQYLEPATTGPSSLAETVSMAPSALKKTFVDQWGGQGLETLHLGLPGCMLEFIIRPAERGTVLSLCLTMYLRLHPRQHSFHLHHLAAFPSVSLLSVFLSLALSLPPPPFPGTALGSSREYLDLEQRAELWGCVCNPQHVI